MDLRNRDIVNTHYKKLQYVITNTIPIFQCYIDSNYELQIELLSSSMIQISIIPKQIESWMYYDNDNAFPRLLGNITNEGYINTMQVGFWKEVPEYIQQNVTERFGKKGIGQFLILIFFYICKWMNIKHIQLDDMASIPGFYNRLGFSYIERDSPPEMIIDLYNSKNVNVILNKILNKSGNQFWKWNKCPMPPSPNPSTLMGGKKKTKKQIASVKKKKNKKKTKKKT